MSQRSYQYDFADSRRLQGDDARVERNIQRMGLAGPSSVLPTRSRGGDGQVTVAEKRASVKGQQERGTLGSGGASGGQEDRCKRGKACGVTCIDPREDCIIDFDVALNSELNRMVNYIKEKAAKAGNPVEAGSERERQIKESVKLAGQHLTGQSASGERMFPTTKPGQSRLLSPTEIADMKANRDKLGKAEFDEVVRKAWQTDTQSRGIKLSKEDLGMIYDALPQSAKNQLAGSGNPGAGKWYALDKDGNEITTGKGKTRDRGIAFLDMYFRQGGTDAYGNSKRVFSPADFDVEHIRPMSKGGIDHPSNWVLARSGAQRQRAEQELGKFIDRLPDPKDRAALAKYYADAKSKSLTKDAAKAALKQVDPMQMSPADLAKISPGNMKYMFAGPSGGKDTFFSNSLIGADSGGTRPSSALPAPIGRLYGLARRTLSESDVETIRSEVRRAWNKDWSLGGGTTQNMVDSVVGSFKSRLSPDVFALVEADVNKWSQGMLDKFPQGKLQ
jgi:hypothetical protein